MHRQLQQISKKYTRKSGLLLVLIFSLLLLGAVIYRYESQNNWLKNDFAKQVQGFQLNNAFAQLRLYIKDAESANRGYAISGDKKFDEEFDTTIDSIRTAYLLLQHLQNRKESEIDTTLFARSDSLMQQKIAWMLRINTLCDDGDRKAALALFATNKGVGLSDSIRKINSKINERLQKELQKSQTGFLVATIENDKLVYFGIADAILLILLVFYFLIKEIRTTERISEELRERKEHFKVTLNSIGEGLITTNLKGEILYMNPSAKQLTGWHFHEAKNQPLQKVFNVINEETGRPFDDIVSRILKSGNKIELENNTLLHTKNSNTLVISNNGAPIFDAGGNVSGAVLVFNDITEKKKIENELKQNRAHLQRIMDMSQDMILTIDNSGKIFSVNAASETILGYTPDVLIGKKIIDFTYVEDREKTIQTVQDIYAGAIKTNFENRLKHKNGTLVPILWSARWDENTKLRYATGKDITIRKRVEEEVKASEKKYRDLIEQAADGIFLLDRLGNFKSVNTNGCFMLGYGKETLRKLNLKDIVPVKFKDNVPITLLKLKSGSPMLIEWQFIRKDGSLFYAEVNAQVTDEGNIQAIVRDITERKMAEKKIRDYQFALDTSSLVDVANKEGIIQYVNENFCRLSQFSKEEIIGNEHRMFSSGYHTREFIKNLWDTITSGKVWHNEVKNKAKDGSYYWVDTTIVPFLDMDEKPFQFITIRTDITKRKEAETGMQTALERYDILSHATSDTIWDWDMVTNQILYNASITKMFGYEISEIENVIDWWTLKIHPDDMQKVSGSFDEAFKNEIQNLQLEYRYKCADETYKFIYDRAFIIYDENKKPIRMIGAMQDVTSAKEEEKRMAKAIIDAQEEERSFIGGELHDNINQILAGSLITLSMAKSENSDKEQTIEYIETTKGYISNAIGEIRKLSHQLAPASFDNTSLQDIFEDLLFSINLNNQYKISLHFDDMNKMQIGDEIQLNLFRILQEQTKNILKYAEATTIDVSVTQSGNVVRMRIYDNGKGFDIKATGKGIGLSNIKKRAESFGGKFILNSEPDKGCEIIVEIPLENNE